MGNNPSINLNYTSGSSITAQNWAPSGLNFGIESIPFSYISAGTSTGVFTIGDTTYSQYSGATLITEAEIYANNLGISELLGYGTSNPNIAVVDNDGHISYVSNGNVIGIVKSRRGWKGTTVSVSSATSPTQSSATNFVGGSFGAYCNSGVIARASGLNPSSVWPVFSTYDYINKIYVRNTGCWAYGLNLSPLSPYNTQLETRGAGTLVSPRHIIFAAHYTLSSGAQIDFVKLDNSVITKTIQNYTVITSGAVTTDIAVGVLDSDVSGVSYCSVLPSGWRTYLPTLGSGNYSNIGLHTLYTDQQEYARIASMFQLSTNAYNEQNGLYKIPINAAITGFYSTPIGGDSGSPVGLVVGTGLVLLSVWHGPTHGNFLADYISQINTAMSGLGGGYELTQISLSGFPSY